MCAKEFEINKYDGRDTFHTAMLNDKYALFSM